MKNVSIFPGALADRLVFGFTAVLLGQGKRALRRLVSALSSIGEVTTPGTKRAERYAQVTLHLITEDGDPVEEVRVDLHVYVDGDNLVFGDRCSIQCDGMMLLRGKLGLGAPDKPCFDGKANFVGPEHRIGEVIGHQLDAIGEAAELVFAALVAAFGESWKPGDLWLKVGEACRDYQTEDAVADVRIVQHATVCGTVERRSDEYQRSSSEERGSLPTLRFLTHANGPEDKLYAKSPTIRRLETCCPNRRKVNGLVGVQRERFSVDGLQRLTLNFLHAASDRLDRLEGHVDSALGGEGSAVALIIALKPLVKRAWGDTKAKGPPSPVATQTAKAALSAFLATGFFDAVGLHSRHAIRRELDALVTTEGPLDKHERRSVYYLKPRFARACAAIQFQHES